MSIDQNPSDPIDREPSAQLSEELIAMLEDVGKCVFDPHFGTINDGMALAQKTIDEKLLAGQLVGEVASMLYRENWLGSSMTYSGKLRLAHYANRDGQLKPIWDALKRLHTSGSDEEYGEFIELTEAPLVMAHPVVNFPGLTNERGRAAYTAYLPTELDGLDADEYDEMVNDVGTFVFYPDEIVEIAFAISSAEAATARLKVGYPELYADIVRIIPEKKSTCATVMAVLQEIRIKKHDTEENPQLALDVSRVMYERLGIQEKLYSIRVDGRIAVIDNESDGATYTLNQSRKGSGRPLTGEIIQVPLLEHSEDDAYLYPGLVVAEALSGGKYAAYVIRGEVVHDIKPHRSFARRTGRIATYKFDSPEAVAEFFTIPDYRDDTLPEEGDNIVRVRLSGEYDVLPLTEDWQAIIQEFTDYIAVFGEHSRGPLQSIDYRRIGGLLDTYAEQKLPELEPGAMMISAPGSTYMTRDYQSNNPEMACLPDDDVLIGGYGGICVDLHRPLRNDRYAKQAQYAPCVLLTGAKIYDTIAHEIEDIPGSPTGQVLIPLSKVTEETAIGRAWRREPETA